MILCKSQSVVSTLSFQGCLVHVKDQYIVDAAVRLNPKLRLSPKFQFSAVHAITRLDLSNNELVELPSCVWTMQSLKFLSVAQNKIESLPKVSIGGGTLRRKKAIGLRQGQ